MIHVMFEFKLGGFRIRRGLDDRLPHDRPSGPLTIKNMHRNPKTRLCIIQRLRQGGYLVLHLSQGGPGSRGLPKVWTTGGLGGAGIGLPKRRRVFWHSSGVLRTTTQMVPSREPGPGCPRLICCALSHQDLNEHCQKSREPVASQESARRILVAGYKDRQRNDNLRQEVLCARGLHQGQCWIQNRRRAARSLPS